MKNQLYKFIRCMKEEVNMAIHNPGVMTNAEFVKAAAKAGGRVVPSTGAPCKRNAVLNPYK